MTYRSPKNVLYPSEMLNNSPLIVTASPLARDSFWILGPASNDVTIHQEI